MATPQTALQIEMPSSVPPISPILKTDSPAQESAKLNTQGNLNETELKNLKLEEKHPSLIGTSFLLANMCFGCAIFSFATHCKNIGVVWFMVFVLIGAVANYWTISRLSKTSIPFNERDYGTLVEKISGRVASIIIDVFITIYSFSINLNCLCAMYQAVGRFIEIVFYNGEYNTYDDFKEDIWDRNYLKYPIVILFAALLFPMCILRDLSKMNFTGYFGVFSIFFGVLIVVIQCHEYYNYYKDNTYIEEDKDTHLNWINIGKGFTKDLFFFRAGASLFFSYAIQHGVLPVFLAFDNDKKGFKDFQFSVFVGMCIVCVLQITSAICSYLTEPIDPEAIIIFRKSIHSGYDIWMTIAKVSFFFAQFFTIPPYHLTFRIGIENIFNKKKPLSTLGNVLFTFLSLAITGIIGVVYDKILNYISYSGGFLCVVFCYFFPIYLWIVTNKKGFCYWLNLLEFIGALILCAIGIIAGIATIIDDAS